MLQRLLPGVEARCRGRLANTAQVRCSRAHTHRCAGRGPVEALHCQASGGFRAWSAAQHGNAQQGTSCKRGCVRTHTPAHRQRPFVCCGSQVSGPDAAVPAAGGGGALQGPPCTHTAQVRLAITRQPSALIPGSCTLTRHMGWERACRGGTPARAAAGAHLLARAWRRAEGEPGQGPGGNACSCAICTASHAGLRPQRSAAHAQG